MLLNRSILVLFILPYGNWYFVIGAAVLLFKESMHKLMFRRENVDRTCCHRPNKELDVIGSMAIVLVSFQLPRLLLFC